MDKIAENQTESIPEGEPEYLAEEAPQPRRRFGRGIYDRKDVPIRLLDGFIAGLIGLIVVLVVVFALMGGYTVSFDSQGGTEAVAQKLRYGMLLDEPEEPKKPGYLFEGWYLEGNDDTKKKWNFAEDKVGSDLVLTAAWIPAEITVKFDAAGGIIPQDMTSIQVVYQESYGELPIPTKEGSTFDGWSYSGKTITKESVVEMPGEHVLTALWK